MLLIPEGEALLQYCHRFEELQTGALSAITRTGTGKNVSVCVSGPSTVMHTRIISAGIRVVAQFSRLLLKFTIDDSNDLISALRAERVN
jgi:LysR family transcriptional regulator (chromosome initiation inhibitor)